MKLTVIYILFSIFSTSLLANNTASKAGTSYITKNDVLGYLQAPNGGYLEVKVLKSPTEQSKGFSGVKAHQVLEHQGMFFYYDKMAPRSFWMPDTYFDLTIIFLDKHLKILHIENNVPHHPGRKEPPSIYRTPTILAHHVLEIKADSPLNKGGFKVGQQFSWIKEPRFQKK